MGRLLRLIRGRVRLAQGRCPGCGSRAAHGCAICRAYHGPLPADDGLVLLWAWRFEWALDAHPAPYTGPRSGSLLDRFSKAAG